MAGVRADRIARPSVNASDGHGELHIKGARIPRIARAGIPNNG
jgi:hypothetical protein